jgi:predicted flap endonuclease-1-like 5' DNA nuclease
MMDKTKSDTSETCDCGKLWLRWVLFGGALVAWAVWQRWQRYLEEQAYPSPVREPAVPPKPAEKPPTPETKAEPETRVEEAPSSTPAEEVPEPDDLTRIEGIGPKVAGVLADAGITTYARLAETEVEALREILRDASLPFMNPVTWPEQAALAAKDAWADLTTLQTDLKGGQRA